MKTILILLSLIFFAESSFANSHAGLKAAFDEFRYNTTVQWNQRDQKILQDELVKFSRTINELKNQGLTNEELLGFLKSELARENIKIDLETMMSVIQVNRLSDEEALTFIHDTLKNSGAEGASWMPAKKIMLAALGIFAIFMAMSLFSLARAAWYSWNPDSTEIPCHQEMVCNETGCFEETVCGR